MNAVSCDFGGSVGSFSLNAQFDAGAGVTALFGPSGAGKTTIIRAICGLWWPDSGRIEVGRELVFDTKVGVFIKPEERRIGAVFQDPLLFPHMSVRGNIAYGCADDGTVDAIARRLDLVSLLDRRPRHLSGGEARRVALARALARRPALLVLDEPFSGLDAERRDSLLPFIREAVGEGDVSALLVTHHLAELAALAGSVVAVEAGQTRAIMPVDEFLAHREKADQK